MLAAATPVTFVLTANPARSRAFYENVLALPLGPQDDYGAVYDLGAAILRVTEIPGFTAGPHPVLGWRVPDITETVADLTAAGIAFTIYEGYGQDEAGIWTAPDGSAKVAWFPDPDGNILSLSEG